MRQTILIVMLCIICAATLMSGCLSTTPEEKQDDPYVFVAQTPRIPTTAPILVNTSEPAPTTDLKWVSSVPEDYYNVTVDRHFVDHELYNYLRKYTWGRPVSIGMWSFREVTELEHELTEKGCNVTIRWADCSTTISHKEFAHRTKTDGYERWGGLPELDQVSCWLMIELDGEQIAYAPSGCWWIFEPANDNEDGFYDRRDRYHERWYYKENTTSLRPGITWKSYNFMDFEDIYEIEEYYMSGEMQDRYAGRDLNGRWWSYYDSESYNATDDFMISFGWWMPKEEYHERESRINRATDWFVCGE